METKKELEKTFLQENESKPGKPVLPTLPEEMTSNKPTHTGVCPGKAKTQMFLAALPISLVLGLVRFKTSYYLLPPGWKSGITAAPGIFAIIFKFPWGNI